MIKINTPIEKYNGIYVKREDLCTLNTTAPPFSKCRGVFARLQKLKKEGIQNVGYLETSISMGGIAVSYYCNILEMQCIIFCPQYKEEPKQLQIHKKYWFNAKIIYIKPNYSQINYYVSKKLLFDSFGKNSVMLPNGLPLIESIIETAKECERTLQKIKVKSIVVCIGSGIICSALLKGCDKNIDIYGILIHKKSEIRKSRDIYKNAGRLYKGILGQNNLRVIYTGFDYTDKSMIQCDFPCNPYYDLKAYQWLLENKEKLKRPILFWNIGSIINE